MAAKHIILCADDYGLSTGINQAIVQLIQLQRLSATSCLVNFPDWLESAQFLLPYLGQIQVGLHFNLTEGKALTSATKLAPDQNFLNINQLIFACLNKKISLKEVKDEFQAQLDRYELAFHKLPDFIDGHQHVHHLPIIREALIQVYQNRLSVCKPYIRSVKVPIKQITQLKIGVIQFTGARQLAVLLQQLHIPHNKTFAGFYDFNPQVDYRQLFQKFIQQVDDQGLIMSHPGVYDPKDLVGMARQKELDYFMSEAYLQDCSEEKVVISQNNFN